MGCDIVRMTSLFAKDERERKLDRIGDPLAAIVASVDFSAIANEVEALLPVVDRTRGGRPPFSVELMVKLLVLKQLYNLSDDQVEYQALDRVTFQRFLGLQSSSRIPDSKTFWLFQQTLMKVGAATAIMAAVQRQLALAGYIARNGQMIDATIVRAPIQHFTKAEKAVLDRGEVPADWSPAKRAQKDLDVRWTKKHGKSFHGYKAHVCADVRHKLARKAAVTDAAVHDTKHFEDLLDASNTSREVTADKGYIDAVREARLNAAGWRMKIQRKAKPGQPLGVRQRSRNTTIARTRARVEHVFAGLHQMGGQLVRTIGIKRAEFQIMTKLAVYNIKRLVSMQQCGIAAF
jgi:IS5 family transposase